MSGGHFFGRHGRVHHPVINTKLQIEHVVIPTIATTMLFRVAAKTKRTKDPELAITQATSAAFISLICALTIPGVSSSLMA